MNPPRRTEPGTTASGPRPRWLALSVSAPARGEELLLVDALWRLGARAVERDGQRFLAYFPDPRDPDRLVADAERAVRASTSIRDVVLSWTWRSDEEWALERAREAGPRRVTDRIVVAPVGREPVLEEGDVVIRLVPGVAFGTAEHGTTRGCLRLLERLVRPGQRVADVGAGSGILSIAAARLGAGRVIALERDPLACDTARENVAANGVTDRVEVRQVDVGPGELRRLAGLGAPGRPPTQTPRGESDASVAPAAQDGIVANLETALILRLLPAFRDALAPDGWLVLSGVPADEPRHVRRAAGALGLELLDELRVDGWWAGCLRRSRARRR